jgi:hypothetical protein
MDKLQKVYKYEKEGRRSVIVDEVTNISDCLLSASKYDGPKPCYLITKEQIADIARTADNLRNAGHAQASLVSTILKQLGVE